MNGINVSQLKVLVADDSRLVCNSILLILREIGFDSSNVVCAYRPNEVINHCKQIAFDIVICDVNFNSQINGYQLLEELHHLQLLKSDLFFAFLTGENQPQIVRTIIDCNPDDYWLKPFNKPFLSARLYSGLKRKKALASVYAAIYAKQYQKALEVCDELHPFHPQYGRHLSHLKAQCYAQLGQYEDAAQQYRALLDEYDCDSVKTALSKVLIEQEEIDMARDVLSTLSNQDNNPYYHDGMAAVCVRNDNIEGAIGHLKLATNLLEAGTERELILSNLSLAIAHYDDAFYYIKRYSEKNENTYRQSEYITLNTVRSFLYRAVDEDKPAVFEAQRYLINGKLDELEKCRHLDVQVTLLHVHIHWLSQDMRSAVSLISELTVDESLHFYDYFHWLYLLEHLSLFNDIPVLLQQAKMAIRDEQIAHIKKSQHIMWANFESRFKDKQRQIQRVKSIMAQWNERDEKEGEKYLEQYATLKALMPNSNKVSMAIIKLLANNRIRIRNYREVFNLLADCHRVVHAQMSAQERNNSNYKKLYAMAKDNVMEYA